MAYRDLRQWIDFLEKAGELKKVHKEVDWNLEVGAITRRVYDLEAPAPLFENIKDYPGYRIMSAPMGLSKRNRYARLSLAWEMPVDSNVRDLTEEYLKRIKNPIKPILVADGPCQEIVYTGDEVNLYKLPAPMIHDGDGGRYISTWHVVITRDPESGWVNYGMYRQMFHERNILGGPCDVFEHIGLQFTRYKAKGTKMEFATAIGTEPVTPIIGATGIKEGVDEADIIGAIRREPLELVKGKTVNLYVPATSEIVIEGYVDPEEKRPEGPFGEYTGYSAGGREMRAVFHVTAITHRKNPILTMSCMGVPVDDAAAILPLTMGAEVLRELRDIKQYPVDFVYFPPEGVCHFGVISTKVPYQAYPRHLAMETWSIKSARLFNNILMIVNDDVDITDMKQIIWAMATRVHPERGVWQISKTYAVPLLPWPSPEERKKMEGPRMLLDATWPFDWPGEWIARVSSFKEIWPKEVQEAVLNRWIEYGFE